MRAGGAEWDLPCILVDQGICNLLYIGEWDLFVFVYPIFVCDRGRGAGWEDQRINS